MSCIHWWCVDETMCFLQWEHLHLTLFCVLGLETWVGPGLASVLENSSPASECQRSDVWGLELRWLLWATCSSLRAFRGPPGVGAAVGSEVSPPARFTLPGAHGDSSGGLPGNYSNFLAPSHWVGRQVHLMNWLQGTWIGEEVNGQQVRLLLCSSSDWLFLLKRNQTCP